MFRVSGLAPDHDLEKSFARLPQLGFAASDGVGWEKSVRWPSTIGPSCFSHLTKLSSLFGVQGLFSGFGPNFREPLYTSHIRASSAATAMLP